MKIVECPRDAMQGLSEFIPTQKIVDYLNMLMQVGFDTLDFGSSNATFENGLLRIQIPLREEVKPRQITIKKIILL